MPFLDHLNAHAALHPDSTAVAVGADVLTYGQLCDLATMRLSRTGIGAGALSVLCEPNGTDFAVSFVSAVAGTGRCAVLDPLWPAELRAEIESRLRETDAELTARAAGGVRRETTLVDGPAGSVFLYGLTSGTTSLPKLFTRTRESWRRACETSAQYFNLTAGDRTLVPGPLSTSLNLYALAESLYAGAALHALSSFDVGDALETIAEHSITRLVAVPTALRLIAERGHAAGIEAGSVTSVVCAGATLDDRTVLALRSWLPNAAIYQYYGAAELNFVAASRLSSAGAAQRTADEETAVGPAFPGVEIRIRDEDGAEAPVGTPGEIFVRSALVSAGYAWGDDGRAFRRDGDWCTVGDIGYLDDGAVLHHLGRGSDMIVTSGHNVYPHEIESIIQRMPGVENVVVTGIPDERRGRRVIAAVIGDGQVDAATLRNAAGARMAEPKRPKAYFRMTGLPLSPAGKISRRILEQWIREGGTRVSPLR